MTSSGGSTGPARSTSSIRADTGSTTERALELGRMLAERSADDDMLGQWMGHHLAALVAAAQDDAFTTGPQRQEIVDLILKVWSHRHTSGGRAPLEEFASVFAGLERLGDERPWRFLRPLGENDMLPD